MGNEVGTYPANLVGTNSTPPSSLALAADDGANAINPRLAACEWTVNKGAPNGYAGLDADGKLPTTLLNTTALFSTLSANIGNSLGTTLPAATGQAWNNGGLVALGGPRLPAPMLYLPGATQGVTIDLLVGAYPLAAFDVDGGGTVDDSVALQRAFASGENLVWKGKNGVAPLVSAPISVTKPGQRISGFDRTTSIVNVSSSMIASDSIKGVFDIESGETGPHFSDIGVYFNQPDTATRGSLIQYPDAFYVNNAARATFDRIRIRGGQRGINLVGNCGGVNINYLESSCFDKNIAIDGCVDKVTIVHPEFWPFGLSANQQQIFYSPGSYGLYSGRCDDLCLTGGIALIGSAMKLFAGASGGTFGQISDFDFDTYGGFEIGAGEMQIANSFWSMISGANFGILKTGGKLSVVNPSVLVAGMPTVGVFVDQTTDITSSFTITGGEMDRTTFDIPLIHVMNNAGNATIDGVKFSADPNTTFAKPSIICEAGAGTILGTNHELSASGIVNVGIQVTGSSWDVSENQMNGKKIAVSSDPALATAGSSCFKGNMNSYGDTLWMATPSDGTTTYNTPLTTICGAKKRIFLTSMTDESGNATIAHNIPALQLRVHDVKAFVKGNSGEATPFSVSSIDGTNIYILATDPSRAVKVIIDYVDTQTSW